MIVLHFVGKKVNALEQHVNVIITRLLLEHEGKRLLSYCTWQNVAGVDIPQDLAAFLVSDWKAINPTFNRRILLREAITSVFPEATLGKFDSFSLKLEQVGYKAWWETEGKHLTLMPQAVDFSAKTVIVVTKAEDKS